MHALIKFLSVLNFKLNESAGSSGFKIPKYKLLFGQQDASKRKKSIVNLL